MKGRALPRIIVYLGEYLSHRAMSLVELQELDLYDDLLNLINEELDRTMSSHNTCKHKEFVWNTLLFRIVVIRKRALIRTLDLFHSSVHS